MTILEVTEVPPTCWYCGAEENDEHLYCAATSDMDAYIEEERLGLHTDCDAPLTEEEIAFVNSS